MYRVPPKKTLWITAIVGLLLLLYFFPQVLSQGAGVTFTQYALQPLNLANALLAILIIVNLAPFLSIQGSE